METPIFSLVVSVGITIPALQEQRVSRAVWPTRLWSTSQDNTCFRCDKSNVLL
jgi:hypothetical protein